MFCVYYRIYQLNMLVKLSSFSQKSPGVGVITIDGVELGNDRVGWVGFRGGRIARLTG
jgi:hypothetical protein